RLASTHRRPGRRRGRVELWWSAASPAGSWRPPPSPSLPLDVCPLDPQPPHATTFFSFPPPRCAPGLGGQAVGGRGGDACDDLVERVLDGEAEHAEEDDDDRQEADVGIWW